MPIKKTPKPKPLYRRKPPAQAELTTRAQRREDDSIFHEVPETHFRLNEDGTIHPDSPPSSRPAPPGDGESPSVQTRGDLPQLIFSHDSPFIRLYQGNCLELLDAIAAKFPHGRFDAIFADPPYFLSNGGITCHAGRMVKVHKGDWDKSRGPELNHEFNREWLARCQKVLKPNGTIWVSGTHHVIFSIGYALQQLGYKILNDIAWEKPNPPPNLSCRYFTHSTETILWAARDAHSKHVFNYDAMRAVTGKQMKTVWRDVKVASDEWRVASRDSQHVTGHLSQVTPLTTADASLNSIWTMSAPATDEKQHGKHPTQKPVALLERCLLASTNEGDLVLDPFLGGGTTTIAAIKLKRGCVGIELDAGHLALAIRRADNEIISILLRHFRVRMEITVVAVYDRRPFENPEGIQSFSPAVAPEPFGATLGNRSQNPRNPERVVINNAAQIDLDLFSNPINGSRVDDKPQVPIERIFHEVKFVFLSCAEVERGAVVHTTVDVSLQEAWAKTPNGKKRETTHVVRCETEIFRVRG